MCTVIHVSYGINQQNTVVLNIDMMIRHKLIRDKCILNIVCIVYIKAKTVYTKK